MPKKGDHDDLHRKLDVILDSACHSLSETVRFVINASYKIVKNKRRPKIQK